jgi:osmotically-inducible protein OsmY
MGPAGFGAPYYQPAPHRGRGTGEPDDFWWPPEPGRAPAGSQRNMHPAHERDFFDKAADEVASWFGDEAAHARREEDHSGRGPRNYQRSDARIEEDVNDRLTDDRMVDATDITVTVKDREVTLDGHVHSRAAKRRAEDCADSVSGVAHVQNNLRVRAAGSDIAG